MRIKNAILAGCAVFFTGSICCAAGGSTVPVEKSATHRVSVPANQDPQQMRPWLNSIKPAAGNIRKTFVIERKEYWQQTVNRSRHNRPRE